MMNVNHEIHEQREKSLVMMGNAVRELLELRGVIA
jgi:hypothetical protein